MPILQAIPIIGQIIDKAEGIIDKWVPDKDLAAKLNHDLQTQMLSLDYGALEKELDAKAKVLVAEVQGQSWLQRNWRPLLMLVFTYIVAHNFVIAPIFGITSVPVPEQMWTLLNIGIGGYIVGRSAEKIVTKLNKDKPS